MIDVSRSLRKVRLRERKRGRERREGKTGRGGRRRKRLWLFGIVGMYDGDASEGDQATSISTLPR